MGFQVLVRVLAVLVLLQAVKPRQRPKQQDAAIRASQGLTTNFGTGPSTLNRVSPFSYPPCSIPPPSTPLENDPPNTTRFRTRKSVRAAPYQRRTPLPPPPTPTEPLVKGKRWAGERVGGIFSPRLRSSSTRRPPPVRRRV